MWRNRGFDARCIRQGGALRYLAAMRVSIGARLFLVFAATSVVLLALALSLVRAGTIANFERYFRERESTVLNRLADGLGAQYAETGDFDFLVRERRRWHRFFRVWQGPPPGPRPEAPGAAGPALRAPATAGPERRAPPPRPRLAVVDTGGTAVFGDPALARDPNALRIDILAHGTVVGQLVARPGRPFADVLEQVFLARSTQTLLLIAGLMLVLSAIAATVMARYFRTPVRNLTRAFARLERGDYSERVPATSQDELGDLARHCNRLAATLDTTRTAQRRWIADISHELRTPVSILTGEIEAVRDGVRPLDDALVRSLAEELARLGALIDDLHTLAMSDLGAAHYRMETLDLGTVLSEAVQRYEERFRAAGLTPIVDTGAAPIRIRGDGARLGQLFRNLLENSCRYTDSGATVRLTLERSGNRAVVTLDDGPPGVPESALAHLFEPLFRLEGSRARASGGSGLGLAICRRIVDAHQGAIRAEASPSGGLRVVVDLPA